MKLNFLARMSFHMGSIRSRLLLAKLIVVASLIVIVTIAVVSFSHLEAQFKAAINHDVESVISATTLAANINEMHTLIPYYHTQASVRDKVNTLARDASASAITQIKSIAASVDNAKRHEIVSTIEKHHLKFEKHLSTAQTIVTTPENEPARVIFINEFQPLLKLIESNLNQLEEYTPVANDETTASNTLLTTLRHLQYIEERTARYLDTGLEEQVLLLNDTIKKLINSVDKLSSIYADNANAAQILSNINTYLSQLTPIANQLIEIRSSEEWNIARMIASQQMMPILARLEQIVNELTTFERLNLQGSRTSVKDTVQQVEISLIIATITGIALALVVLLWAIRYISGQIDYASRMASRISRGNFSMPVSDRGSEEFKSLFQAIEKMRTEMALRDAITTEADELIAEHVALFEKVKFGDLSTHIERCYQFEQHEQLKNSVGEALMSLGEAIQNTQIVATNLSNGVSAISETAEKFASTFDVQSGSINMISDQMRAADAEVQNNAHYAREMREISEENTEVAGQGHETVERMLEAMHEIAHSSKEIKGIIEIIDEIAFQTNLLSLNAAIEAGRAGKFGKSFAVVAQEVRDLATRSSQSVENTSQLIEESAALVRNGQDISTELSFAFERILANVKTGHTKIADISEASDRQAENIKAINHSLSNVSNDLSENAAETSNLAKSVANINQMTQLLLKEMQRFNLG